ncbi:MAG: hypothetical protein HWN66_21555, partial [Candidatus Helarchaeota archaeon]|nr:hypothetical protein [Candidatus Helarchaeota archaeon]
MNYPVTFRSNEIWNEPKRIVPYLLDWVQSQRWTGKSTHHEITITEKDEFLIYTSDLNKIIGFLLELHSSKNQNYRSTYFVPIEIARKVKNFKDFSIILNCQDEKLFLRPAEENKLFFQTLLKDLINNREIQTLNSNKIQFNRLFSKFNSNLNITSTNLLGNGNTTNTLFKIRLSDDSKLIIKIFRIFSRNPEVKMLKMLYQAGFHHVPQPLGSVSVKLDDQLYLLILFSEFIESVGDGGIYFWTNLNQQINSWKPGNTVQPDPLKFYCESLGKIVSDLHYYSSRIDDDFFKPEIISQKDIMNWKRK